MTYTAIVSAPLSQTARVGYLLSRGTSDIPTREEAAIERTYFLVPLCMLHGTGLFADPTIDVQYFSDRSQAMGWAERDIRRRRREVQRLRVQVKHLRIEVQRTLREEAV